MKLALSGPNIDWGYQDSDATSGQTLREDWRQDVAWHPPDAPDFQVFGGQDLRLLGNGTRTVVFQVTGGSVNHLFYNPHHRQQVLTASLGSPAPDDTLQQRNLPQAWTVARGPQSASTWLLCMHGCWVCIPAHSSV